MSKGLGHRQLCLVAALVSRYDPNRPLLLYRLDAVVLDVVHGNVSASEAESLRRAARTLSTRGVIDLEHHLVRQKQTVPTTSALWPVDDRTIHRVRSYVRLVPALPDVARWRTRTHELEAELVRRHADIRHLAGSLSNESMNLLDRELDELAAELDRLEQVLE